uniref:Uncharacterized protein n=1 Tax=Lepeophtheirus salmonis TaxID=72036 RepID=A0A0K2T3T6_LEPSM
MCLYIMVYKAYSILILHINVYLELESLTNRNNSRIGTKNYHFSSTAPSLKLLKPVQSRLFF